MGHAFECDVDESAGPAGGRGGSVMGHRALLARERESGRYDVYYSHWGGADPSLARDLDAEPWTHPQVDPDPLATDVAWADLLAAHLDPLCHELLVVLPASGPPEAFRPFDPGPLDAPAVLVAVDPADPRDDPHVLGWGRGARAGLRTAFEARVLDATAAGAAFRRAVEGRFDGRATWLDEPADAGL